MSCCAPSTWGQVKKPMGNNGWVRRLLFLFVLVAVGGALSSTALGHGEIDSAIPEPESTAGRPPNHLIINFTEAPTKDAVFKVLDGCGTNLIDVAEIEDGTGHVFLTKGGEPGEWKVSYKIVSAVDGHPTKGSYGLTVKGKKDCSEAGDPGGGDPQGNAGGGNGGGAAGAPPGDGDDGGSFPVIPVALGTVGVVALAFIARRAAG
jgi:methionine-rich copper-binding protein CopC